jgi:hypothetical protein
MHRRKREGQKLTMENELWKRAFWSVLRLFFAAQGSQVKIYRFLIAFDRFTSSFLGKPSTIQGEE